MELGAELVAAEGTLLAGAARPQDGPNIQLGTDGFADGEARWSNWCGPTPPGPVALRIGGAVNDLRFSVDPPPCVDPSQPSTLTTVRLTADSDGHLLPEEACKVRFSLEREAIMSGARSITIDVATPGCVLAASHETRLWDAKDTLLASAAARPGADTASLFYGALVSGTIQWTNWCHPAPDWPLHVKVVTAGRSNTIELTSHELPDCVAPDRSSLTPLEISNIRWEHPSAKTVGRCV